MKEIKISINMDDNNKITIFNKSTWKTLEIDYTNKMINASDVYDVLSYTTESKYLIESNIDLIDDGNERDYFVELIQLIKSITDELNNLNGVDNVTEGDNSEENNIDNNNELLADDNDSLKNDDLLS